MDNKFSKILAGGLTIALLVTVMPLHATENVKPVGPPAIEEPAPSEPENPEVLPPSENPDESTDPEKPSKPEKPDPSEKPMQPTETIPQPAYNDDHFPADNVTVVSGILLANKTHPLGPDYVPSHAIGVGQTNALYGEANAAMNRFINACNAQGHHMYVISGYRSYEVQKYLFARYASIYGEQRAAEFSSRPGYSEHQTGLTFDVGDAWHSGYNLEIISEQLPSMQWMMTHCADYGFILRYPKGKEAITGYQYEPWHYRYVGIPAAKEIMQSGMTLEEFLGEVGDRRIADGHDHNALRIDGVQSNVSSYVIDGYNYFRLRDLATLLIDSDAPFEVTYDPELSTISVKSHTPYSQDKTLIKLTTKDIAVPNSFPTVFDGVYVTPKAYAINGYTYFKLRDLGQLLDFKVDWDAEAGSMVIETREMEPIEKLLTPVEGFEQEAQNIEVHN